MKIGLISMFAGSQTVGSIADPGGMPLARSPVWRCRVVLADGHHLFLTVLERFMASSPEIDVVAVATTGRKALALVNLHRPDLVVISIAMPDISGRVIAKQLARKSLAPKVILTALDDDPVYRLAARAAGAAGYVAKSDLGPRIFPLIRSLF
jgi:DNA-binding NarL/FixJ family response regulator